MKVNRSRFLLLTAAIAGTAALSSGAGCTVNNTTVNGDGGTTQGDATAGGDSSTSDGASGDTGTGGDGSADTGNDSATCDDTTGSAPDCAAAADAGAGCGMNATFQARCAAWVANLKPVVAKAAVDCAIALPTCESGAGTEVCLTNALNASCADTTAVAVCTTIDADCADAGALDSGVTDMQCATYVSGLNSAGRTAIQTCFDTGMCATEFPDCISNTLLPP